MRRRIILDNAATLHDRFGRFAVEACSWLGSTWAFGAAALALTAWVIIGVGLHFTQSWQQVLSTGTAVATFLMVFLIQNTQNRDAKAINLKLNELIRAGVGARNQLIDIERLSDQELDEMQVMYERIKTAWTDRQSNRRPDLPL